MSLRIANMNLTWFYHFIKSLCKNLSLSLLVNYNNYLIYTNKKHGSNNCSESLFIADLIRFYFSLFFATFVSALIICCAFCSSFYSVPYLLLHADKNIFTNIMLYSNVAILTFNSGHSNFSTISLQYDLAFCLLNVLIIEVINADKKFRNL